jgi:hypothetical protein
VTPLLPLAGIRLGALQPVDAVGYEQILVTTPREAPVTQGVLRGSAEVGRLAFEGSVPWVFSTGGGYTDGGVGRIRLAMGVWVGRRRAWQLGGEVAGNGADGPRGSVLAWATRARDVVPGAEFLVHASWAHPDGYFGARIALGGQSSEYIGGWPYYLPILGDLALVGQVPVTDRWTVALEADLCVDQTWLTFRPAMRYGREPLSVDVGVQAPPATFLDEWSFQPFVQVRLWRLPGPVDPSAGP